MTVKGFLRSSRKGGDSGGRRAWEELGKVGGGEPLIRIYCRKKSVFNKRKFRGIKGDFGRQLKWAQ